MNILVTGASGNLGRRLTKRLETGGATIWHGVRQEASGPGQVRLELGDPQSVDTAIEASNPDQVIHLAAWVDVRTSFEDPRGAYDTNVLGTLALLDALRRRKSATRFLYLSTSHVYGIPPEGVDLIGEEVPAGPVSPYAASKLAAEDAVRLYDRISEIEPVIVRMFNLVGSGLPATSVCAAMARRVFAVTQGTESCPLQVGNLKSQRDFIALEDALDGLVAALEKGRAGETYNLCTGRGTSVQDILDELARLAGIEITTQADPERLRKVDPPRVVGNPAKLQRDTGFAASRSLAQAVADLWGDLVGGA